MTPSRSRRRLVPAALLAGLAAVSAPLLVPLGSASAATVSVSVTNFRFSPASVTVGQGGKVAWTFHSLHTTTSNQGFWDSGMRSSGTFTMSFADAGTFGYHCTMHPFMTGSVKVPMRATGSASHGWKLTWSTRSSTPSNRRYDVQERKPGSSHWSTYRTATSKRSATFDPAHHGKYAFRARTHNGSRGASGWSPTLLVRIS
jgi:plastocyanin